MSVDVAAESSGNTVPRESGIRTSSDRASMTSALEEPVEPQQREEQEAGETSGQGVAGGVSGQQVATGAGAGENLAAAPLAGMDRSDAGATVYGASTGPVVAKASCVDQAESGKHV